MPTRKDKESKGKAEGSELVLTRVFDAPRERVWKAWTNPEEFKRWWGPKDFTAPVARFDLRVGGKYLNCMRSPDGKEFWSTGVFREIVSMSKLVLTDSFADEKGNVVPASYYGMPADIPLETIVTVTFEDLDGKTKMTLRHAGLPSGPQRTGAGQGWSESFEKMAAAIERL
jgi:uncharacterized protein YndB with AHSA1/START domain